MISRTKVYTADTREMYAWGFGGITNHALICTFGQVTNIFILGFGLSPIIVSWVMTLPRLLDGLIDPFLGHLSDDTYTRWGRRKPFMLAGSLLASIFLVAIWFVNQGWPTWFQFVYLLVCTTMFYSCWGMYSMAWTAIGYELTDDYHERSRVQGIGGLFATAVFLVNSWIYWFALRPMFGIGDGKPYQTSGIRWIWEFTARQVIGDPTVRPNEVNGIRWIAGTIAAVALIASFVCILGCKERFTHVNRKKQHVPLLQATRTTLHNRPFVVLLVYKSLGLLSGRVCGGIAGFLGLYYVCGGNKDLSFRVAAILGTLNMVFGFILMPCMKYFSELLGKRKALIMGAIVAFVAALIAPLVTLPGHPYLPLIPALIVVPLTIIANTLGDAMLPDICDYDELQCGQRREGLFTSVLAFFSKMEMSAAALGVGYLISWTGYNKSFAMQSDAILNRMWWIALIPTIVCNFVALLVVFKFPLTESKMADIRKELDRRRVATATSIGKPSGQINEPTGDEAGSLATGVRTLE